MSIVVIGQIATAVAVIILVLLQNRSEGAGGAFGGGGGGGDFLKQRRGAEKILFVATIVFASVFAALSILSLILH